MLNEQISSLGDSYDLLDGRNDEEAREEWLEAARTIGAARSEGQTEEEEARTRKAVRAAMEVGGPGEARSIAKRATARSLQSSARKRRELKKLIKARRGVFVGHMRHRAKKAGASQKPLFDMLSGGLMGGGSTSPTQGSDQWGEHYAYCVFDVLSAVNSVARVASDINDAVKTCKHVKPSELLQSENRPENVHAKVCSVNVFAALGGLNGIAAVLSSAANNCASTLVPNVDAVCASGIINLLGAISGFGGGLTLVSAACRDKGWYQDIPKDRFPHNVGSNEMDYLNKDADGGRLLAEAPDRISEEPTASAPPRQLLFGGGRASTATQCATEINSVMWNLASVGLAINGAGNQADPNCPPKNLKGETNPKKKGIVYEMSQGYCAVDVESAITSFLAVITMLQLVAVNCVDALNIEAICGAGVTTILAGSAGIAQAATAIWGSCDTAQREPIKSILTAARRFDLHTGAISSAMAGDSADAVFAGRRLARVHDQVEDLKRRFATPEEAWMSIGYDLNNASAVFRKAHLPEPDLKMFASLVEEPEAVKDDGVGLFGGQHTCSD